MAHGLFGSGAFMSGAELAAAKLAGIPATTRGVQLLAARHAWPSRPRIGHGGGREYAVAALPAAARAALASRHDTAIDAPVQAPVAAPLNATQRATLEARAAVLGATDQLVAAGHSRAHAVAAIVAAARAGTLDPALQAMVPVANARAGTARTLSRSALYQWLATRAGGVAALAPSAAPPAPPAQWAERLIALYARPSKPTLTDALASWPAAEAAPSYHQAWRFLDRWRRQN